MKENEDVQMGEKKLEQIIDGACWFRFEGRNPNEVNGSFIIQYSRIRNLNKNKLYIDKELDSPLKCDSEDKV